MLLLRKMNRRMGPTLRSVSGLMWSGKLQGEEGQQTARRFHCDRLCVDVKEVNGQWACRRR